jgi:hypothetical protein
VWLGAREIDVVDLLAAVLGRVAEEAARVAGGLPAEVVLTHPATWGATRIRRLAVAAGRAGPAGLRFMAEPVAAAVYFAAVRGRQVTRGSSNATVRDKATNRFLVSVVGEFERAFQNLLRGQPQRRVRMVLPVGDGAGGHAEPVSEGPNAQSRRRAAAFAPAHCATTGVTPGSGQAVGGGVG